MTREAVAHSSKDKAGQSRPSKDVHFIRLANLKQLIDKRFDGKAARLAKEIKRSHTYLWQLLNEYRSIGEVTARNIEVKLGLDERDLDKKLGAFERTMMLTHHLGNGSTVRYRMCPMVSLNDFDSPSKKAEDLRPCPLGDENGPMHMRTGKRTRWFYIEVDAGPLREGEMCFVDPDVTKLEKGTLYVVKPKRSKSGKCVVRVAARTGDGDFMLRPLKASNGKEPTYAEDDVIIKGRIFFAMRVVGPVTV